MVFEDADNSALRHGGDAAMVFERRLADVSDRDVRDRARSFGAEMILCHEFRRIREKFGEDDARAWLLSFCRHITVTLKHREGFRRASLVMFFE